MVMEKILFLAPTEPDGSLSRGALETLATAHQIAQDLPEASLAIGLWGRQVASAAQAIASCGAKLFLGVEGDDFASSRTASDAAAMTALVRAAEATLVLAPTGTRTARALPVATVRSGGRIDSHATGLDVHEGQLRLQRWYYRQRMQATLSRAHRPWFILADPGFRQPWHGTEGDVAVKPVPVDLPSAFRRTEVEGTEAAQSGTQTIRPEAKILLVAGAGWTKKQADGQVHAKDAERLILSFLSETGASLGGSKSMVEQSGQGQDVLSFMSHLNQIGQTGSTPRHPKGLATCCHGEEPHVVGWRFIQERRAINTDASCGWAQGKADVLYVADAFAVMTKVNELLGKS
jgi:electron transfer flavoprotein alpha subunit